MKSGIQLIFLALVLACGQPSRAAGSDSQAQTGGNDFGQSTAKSVPIIDALEDQASKLERDFTNQVILGGRQTQTADESPNSSTTIWVLVSLTLALFAWRKYAPAFGELLGPNYVLEPAAPLARADTAAEEEAFSRFAAAFSVRLQRPDRAPPEDTVFLPQPPAPKDASPPAPVRREPDPLDACLAGASQDLAGIRTSFSEINRAPDETTRQAALGGLLRQVRSLKARSELPAVFPVWQLSSALEGLLDQIANNPDKTTPSAFRTIAGAVDLLHALCVRGMKPNLLSDPPVRLLAVDDDPISRHVVAFALSKVFTKPDLATDGAAALVLAQQQSYDAVFLDVQMPGMDGFELCFRIHGTALNQTTPVVFVTTQGDLGSRAKSSLTGGQDLLAKPILTWELALKALTLIMSRRLHASLAGAEFLPRDSTASRSPALDPAAVCPKPSPATPASQPHSPVPAPA